MDNHERRNGLRELRQLTPRDFEFLIADIWEECQGWDTEITEGGADGGVDVLGWPPNGGAATAVQAKRYDAGNKIGRPEVQQYSSLPNQYEAIGSVTIVTTSNFTKGARNAAEYLEVKLIDGGDLLELIDRYGAEEIVAWYCEGKPTRGNT